METAMNYLPRRDARAAVDLRFQALEERKVLNAWSISQIFSHNLVNL